MSDIRVPHRGQPGQASTAGKAAVIVAILTSHKALAEAQLVFSPGRPPFVVLFSAAVNQCYARFITLGSRMYDTRAAFSVWTASTVRPNPAIGLKLSDKPTLRGYRQSVARDAKPTSGSAAAEKRLFCVCLCGNRRSGPIPLTSLIYPKALRNAALKSDSSHSSSNSFAWRCCLAHWIVFLSRRIPSSVSYFATSRR